MMIPRKYRLLLMVAHDVLNFTRTEILPDGTKERELQIGNTIYIWRSDFANNIAFMDSLNDLENCLAEVEGQS